jgi:hypothetical protein
VCGRTILDGEQVHSYVSAEGRHGVCSLCAARTAELGWLPADQDGAEEALRVGAERRLGFFARLFAREEREESEPGAADKPDAEPESRLEPEPRFWDEPGEAEGAESVASGAVHELDTERYDVEAEWGEDGVPARKRLKDLFAPAAPHGGSADPPIPDAAPVPDAAPAPDAEPAFEGLPDPEPPADPAGRGMRPRRLQPDLDLPPADRFERAISRFNAGEAGRTVAGLTRTLGAPSVSVGDSAGAADEVRVTVAWELTWYQWGVDLGDELRPVYELSKGFEVEEIDAAARQWNASAHDGRIVMVAPPRRRAAAGGRPVHR